MWLLIHKSCLLALDITSDIDFHTNDILVHSLTWEGFKTWHIMAWQAYIIILPANKGVPDLFHQHTIIVVARRPHGLLLIAEVTRWMMMDHGRT